MAEFDISAARQAGLSDYEIAQGLAPKLNYDLEGARKAGLSDKDIADGLSSKFSSTPGGAATGIARPNTRPRISPFEEQAASIAGAGGIGAAMGAALPEILTAGAGVARSIPQGARIAPYLESAAIAAKSAGRPAGAVMGAVGGLASETAGQVAEGLGAGPALETGARFVAGGVTPQTLPLAKGLYEAAIKIPSLSLTTFAGKQALKKLGSIVQGRPQDISEQEAAQLNGLLDTLRQGKPVSDAAQKGVYGALRTGADTALAVGETEANTILRNAAQSIKQETDKTLGGPVAYVKTAADRIARRGEDALATAQMQRTTIGQDKDPTDIGTILRDAVVKRNEAAVTERDTTDKALRKARNDVVAQKEGSGQIIQSMPEYHNIVASLEAQTVPGQRSKEVASTFQNILDTLKGGKGESLGPYKIQGGPVTFQAVDDLRRSLGEAFRGKPPVGFEGIDRGIAKEYYAKLSNLQEQFAGDAQKQMQTNYADKTAGLEMFGSRAGKKATTLDNFMEESYQADPALLARDYFSSKTKVADLVKLTGDRAAVVKAAGDFAATELNGKTGPQVRDWMTQRRELLSALPEVRDSVLKYANSLDRGESIANSASSAVKKLQAYSTSKTGTLNTTTGDIQAQADTAANAARAGATQKASTLVGNRGDMFGAQEVENLILHGNTDRWAAAAPAILRAPGGQEMMADSIRQVMSNKASQSINGLTKFFNDNVRPALDATKIMRPEQVDSIHAQLAKIETMKLTEPQKIGLARRLIFQSFGGLAAGKAAEGAVNAGSGLVNLIPQ
jgi:hypothetical protein